MPNLASNLTSGLTSLKGRVGQFVPNTTFCVFANPLARQVREFVPRAERTLSPSVLTFVGDENWIGYQLFGYPITLLDRIICLRTLSGE
jgi:hypothetical protein